jgi:sirohydrochlorin cobaltochelatase
MRALILFGHGSRDARWAEPMRRVQAMIEASDHPPKVALAFLEFMAPDMPAAFDDLVAQGATSVQVAPMFLGQGGHLRRDLSALIDRARKAHPSLNIEVLPALGESESILRALADWARGD